MTDLRLGILGMSEGNGHPYSWSAIFNGYHEEAMATCPFPVIPAYLKRQTFPADCIAGAAVTHVWTQSREVSEHVAAAANIPYVVDDRRDMLGQVDAVLLARDDAESHYEIAGPFLDAGLPIYIDKPVALTIADAKKLYGRQKAPGQIFTCTALAFAPEFQLSRAEIEELGALRYVEAITVKDWDRYAIHVLEPLCNLLAEQGGIARARPTGGNVRHLDIAWASGLTGRVTALGTPRGPIAIRLYGENGHRDMSFRDAFATFRNALSHFVEIVRGDRATQDPAAVLEIVRLVEAGRAERTT
jgi:predicted dehydrogenase